VAPTSAKESSLEKRNPPKWRDPLRAEPFDFDFFQAVRLLTRLCGPHTRRPVFGSGRGNCPLRLGARTRFPPSQIAKTGLDGRSQPRMDVNFMGLTGPQASSRSIHGPPARAPCARVTDPCGIFRHLPSPLHFAFYRAWEKHHFTVAYERNEKDPLSQHLMDLLGLGTPGLSSRQMVPDEALLFRCGAPCGACPLRLCVARIIDRLFCCPRGDRQFAADGTRSTETLSAASAKPAQTPSGWAWHGCGRRDLDQQSVIRIRLGPLTLAQYLEFLPDGQAHPPLRALVRFFAA